MDTCHLARWPEKASSENLWAESEAEVRRDVSRMVTAKI